MCNNNMRSTSFLPIEDKDRALYVPRHKHKRRGKRLRFSSSTRTGIKKEMQKRELSKTEARGQESIGSWKIRMYDNDKENRKEAEDGAYYNRVHSETQWKDARNEGRRE